MSKLETKRLRLLPWRHADFRAFRQIATDPDVMRYIGDGKPWDDDKIREFMRRQMRHAAARNFCMWRIVRKPGGTMLGFCGLQPVTVEGRREIEIGWWLAKTYWHRGLASEAAREAMRFAFDEIMLSRVIAISQPENRASIHIMRKLGMRLVREATHKGIRVVLYSIRQRALR
jgi:[ribosomal protein S5]-alanine N-acetyltransferase